MKKTLLGIEGEIIEPVWDERKQREYDKINKAYGRAFDKKYEKRMREYRKAEKRIRDFVIDY